MNKQNFSKLKEGNIVLISWLDPKTAALGSLAFTKSIGFYFLQDKNDILISNMKRGEGKSTKYNASIIPKNLITEVEIVRKRIK